MNIILLGLNNFESLDYLTLSGLSLDIKAGRLDNLPLDAVHNFEALKFIFEKVADSLSVPEELRDEIFFDFLMSDERNDTILELRLFMVDYVEIIQEVADFTHRMGEEI